MMGRMEAGEGRGGLSEESSPFLPKLPARFASLPEVFWLLGRRPGRSTVGCGWGKVRQIFCGETRLIHKGCEPSNGIADFTG